MKFETSSDTREFIEGVYARVGARNQAVLGRAALFMAMGSGVPAEYKPKDAKGVTLNDEQVVGDDLKDLVRAALNHRAGRALDDGAYKQVFRQYFEYGCMQLRKIWEDCGKDQAKFVAELLKGAGGDDGLAGLHPSVPSLPVIDAEVKLKVLNDTPAWSINGPGTKNGLLVISGEPGSGKSQLALDLLAQLSAQGVRFVFFDLKGELEDDPNNLQQRKNRTQFLQQTGAKYVRLIHEGLPINPLIRAADSKANAQIAYEMASLVRCFAPQLGAKQERNICDAYQRLAEPDFGGLEGELQAMGANGVDLAVIQKIVRFGLFADHKAAVPVEAWLNGSLVVDFKELNNDRDTKALAVALILNLLMKRLNSNLGVKGGIQPLKMVLFVDEAHLLLPKENKAGLLGALARQGRSWGFPVWLASQDADAFVTTGSAATNFAELAECGMHFSPAALTESQQKQILGGVVRTRLNKAEAALRMQGRFTTGAARQFWRDGGAR